MSITDNMIDMGQKDRWAIARRQEHAEKSASAPPPPAVAPDDSAAMLGPKQSILVIDDEPPLQKFLRLTLSSRNFNVIEALTGESGLRHAANDQPDLVILDLGLPDMDGVEVTRRIREWSAIPIVVVSARGKEQDKVVALDAGADDYLTKPFSVGELMARVRVALRHAAPANPETGQPVFTVGVLQIDLLHRRVSVAERDVHLTPNEFRLLATLVKHAGMVVT